MRTLTWSLALPTILLATLPAAAQLEIQHGRALVRQEANTLSPAEVAAGWTLLFDGTSTDAWRGYRRDAFPDKGWVVEEGTLRVKAGGGGGDIITTDTYTNFEFMLDWKVSPNANSGIMYRVTEEGGASWNTGPEYQILDDAGANFEPTNIHSAGALYDLVAPGEGKVNSPTGEWNHTRIRLNRGWVEHWLNGVLVVKVKLDSDEFATIVDDSKFDPYEGFGIRKTGHIALQDHGHDVWFTNMKIRDLDAALPGEQKLFYDGTSFTNATGFARGEEHWQDSFYIEDGLLKTRGQPSGYIRTTNDYTNFVVKLQWRFNPQTKKEGNGGVLVRMIEDDKVWPRSIEAQLQSRNAGDFWNIDKFDMQVDPDRTRGRNTRKTHFAENPVGEWNEYEIIVDGNDVILKVNGQTLNHAWNVAEVAGKICLQSEGSEMHFRNIRVAPIGR